MKVQRSKSLQGFVIISRSFFKWMICKRNLLDWCVFYPRDLVQKSLFWVDKTSEIVLELSFWELNWAWEKNLLLEST